MDIGYKCQKDAERHCILEISGHTFTRGLNLEGLEKCVEFGHSTF